MAEMTLEEIKIAAALDAPDFEKAARLALSDVPVAPELAEAIGRASKRAYAMGLREARGGAHGVANRLPDGETKSTLLGFASALDELAERIWPAPREF